VKREENVPVSSSTKVGKITIGVQRGYGGHPRTLRAALPRPSPREMELAKCLVQKPFSKRTGLTLDGRPKPAGWYTIRPEVPRNPLKGGRVAIEKGVSKVISTLSSEPKKWSSSTRSLRGPQVNVPSPGPEKKDPQEKKTTLLLTQWRARIGFDEKEIFIYLIGPS